MLKIQRYKLHEHIIPVCLLLLTAVYFSLSTNFFFYSNGSYGHDAGIFAYIGWAMKQGRTLYTEVWENKGPLLYFINMLGVSIDYAHGIYWLELISLFVTALFSYKTALLLTTRYVATFAAIFSMLSLSVSLEGGNLSEEYALPFLCIGLYLATKFYANNHSMRKYEMAILGACIAAVLLLRANIIMLFAAIVIVTLIVLIKNKAFKMLAQIFLFTLIGFLIFIFPFFVYLIINGALKSCLNIAYIGVLGTFVIQNPSDRFANVLEMLLSLAPSGALYLMIIFLVTFTVLFITGQLKDKNTKYVFCFVALGMILNLWANTLSGVYHMHYFMTFVPFLIIPAAWLFNMIYTSFSQTSFPSLYRPISILVLVLFLSFNAIPPLILMVSNNLHTNKPLIYKQLDDYIKQNTEPDELIQFFGGPLCVTANYRTSRLSGSKYNYYANGWFSSESKQKFASEIAMELETSHPTLIIFTQEKQSDFLEHIQDRKKWDEFFAENYTQQNVDFNLLVYRLNN